MLKLSRKTLLALEAVIDIAFNGRPEPVQAKEITARQGVPQRYLEQVMQQLVRAGVLKGVRGPRGGYRLAKERRRISVGEVVRVGRSGVLYTAVGITFALGLGLLLGWLFRVGKTQSFLISAGTAICGGSAIAALGPVTGATEEAMAVSMGTVFVLNSVALLIFPVIGGALHLSQTQFGLWAALAIHDTSSVVGASAKYGSVALAVGTMVVMLVLGAPLGILSAVRPQSTVSRVIGVLNALALALPTFWLGILLLLLFAVSLQWLPPSGYVSIVESPWQTLRLLVLPCLTLGASNSLVNSIAPWDVRAAYV